LMKSQAVLDFLISYGIAILIIAIAVLVVFQQGILNVRLAPIYCNGTPTFVCQKAIINTSGALTLVFVQTTGGTLQISGIACSTQPNTIAQGPKYGNVNLWSYSKAPQYYPNSALSSGLTVYSSNITRVYVNCYGSSGIGRGGIGGGLTGYVWVNYTVSSLPSNYRTVQQIVSFDLKYT